MSSITKIQIMNYLDEQGFKHANAGFPFIVDILKDLCDQQVSRQNISIAYARVAEHHETSKENVEKCIRFAVKHSKCFVMSNKEFLCQAYDRLVYDETEVDEEILTEDPPAAASSAAEAEPVNSQIREQTGP